MQYHCARLIHVIPALVVGLTAAVGSAAPAADPVSSADARIIHLSDPHFTSQSRTLDTGYYIDYQNSRLKSALLSGFLIDNKDRLRANTVVITGDITDSGDVSDYQVARDFVETLKGAGYRVCCVPGNHDCSKEGTLVLGQYESGTDRSRRENFSKYIDDSPYPRAVDLGGAWLILLDSLQGQLADPGRDFFAQGLLGAPQRAQLAADLARLQSDREAGKKIVVCLHHAPFKVRGARGDEDPADSRGNNVLDDAREFLSVISHRVDSLLFGHTTPAGILQQGHGWFRRQQLRYGIRMINCVNLEHLPWYREMHFGSKSLEVCTAANRDGRLAVFHIGTNANLHRNEQRVACGGWRGQDPPGRDDGGGWRGAAVVGSPATHVCAAQNQDGRLEVFYAGWNGRLNHDWQTRPDGPWHGRVEMGKPIGEIRHMAAACNLDGRLELFLIGPDGRIMRTRQSAHADSRNWKPVEPLVGCRPALQLCAARNQDGRLELFYTAADRAVCHVVQESPGGNWSGEKVLSPPPPPSRAGTAAGICVEQNRDGRLELFHIGPDNEIMHNWQTEPNGAWHGEAPLGGKNRNTGTQICAGRSADGRIEVFYAGTNALLYHNWQTTPGGDTWAGEEAIYGLSDKARQISVARNADGRLEIFYVGTDGQLYRNFQTIPNAAYPVTVIDLGRLQREVYDTANPDAPIITSEKPPLM